MVVARPSVLRRGDLFGLRACFFLPRTTFFLCASFFFAAGFFFRAFLFLAIGLEVYHRRISETTRSRDERQVSFLTSFDWAANTCFVVTHAVARPSFAFARASCVKKESGKELHAPVPTATSQKRYPPQFYSTLSKWLRHKLRMSLAYGPNFAPHHWQAGH